MCFSVHVRPGHSIDQHDALEATPFPDLVRREVRVVRRQLVDILQTSAERQPETQTSQYDDVW